MKNAYQTYKEEYIKAFGIKAWEERQARLKAIKEDLC